MDIIMSPFLGSPQPFRIFSMYGRRQEAPSLDSPQTFKIFSKYRLIFHDFLPTKIFLIMKFFSISFP